MGLKRSEQRVGGALKVESNITVRCLLAHRCGKIVGEDDAIAFPQPATGLGESQPPSFTQIRMQGHTDRDRRAGRTAERE